ncbi:MAG TPA: coenzyme F420-0:L-glutamate ligase [Thermoanaerobaculia bacterium]|jgi:coenzyme F420-0:L-glutamate ligase/coenzyme F420-1:gamma-L-glutamate ligase|nr:coenzyme F420-0:L-glutamate ligase [Thermoanaerobaculia bacterium]
MTDAGAPRRLTLTALPGIPMVEPGADLAAIILDGVARAGETLRDRDVLVVAQKIVSKSENRYVDLRTIVPSEQASALAREVDKDPRLVEVILGESSEVVRYRTGVLVVAHRLGFVLANAGVDQSNITHEDELDRVLLLPENPDASAARLRDALRDRAGVDVGVIVNDSLGRPWRNGTVGVALGAAGVQCLQDLRGTPDLFGRTLRVTEVGVGDELASAASLLMGQAGESTPVILARGVDLGDSWAGASALLRSKSMDLFR